MSWPPLVAPLSNVSSAVLPRVCFWHGFELSVKTLLRSGYPSRFCTVAVIGLRIAAAQPQKVSLDLV
jgi:hypothetical protein